MVQATSYTWEEAPSHGKVVLTAYGPKGSGKTTAAMGLSGKRYLICFDDKAKRVHESQYAAEKDIVVLDGTKYYSEQKDELTAAGQASVDWVFFLLEEIQKKNDASWVIFDFVPKWAEMCEMAMRHQNKIGPTQGIVVRTIWKERQLMMRRAHSMALDAVAQRTPGKRCGVVYTTYVKQETLAVHDGETLESMRKPNYQDIVEQETDVVLYVTKPRAKDGGFQHLVTVESNKFHVKGSQDGLASAVDGEVLDLSGGVRLAQLLNDL